MRAAGVDAFAAAVGERGRPGPAEQARQPAGQVAADHVTVLGIGRPSADQLRQYRRPARERALKRVLEVEQAEVILAALAHDDPAGALVRLGEQLRPLGIELALKRLGEGRNPHRPARPLRPQRRRSEISERLADPRSGLGEQQVGRALRGFGREDLRHCFRHRALPLARLGAPGERVEPRTRISRIDADRPRRRPFANLIPLLEAREKHPLAALGPIQSCPDQRRPAPAKPLQRRIHGPGSFALAPVRIVKDRKQSLGNQVERFNRLGIACGRIVSDRTAETGHRRHRELRGPDEREELQKVEPAHLGIAEPLPDERRVEDDVRSLGGPSDRFAATRLANLAIPGCQPDAGMRDVKRRDWKGHGLVLVRVSFPLARRFARIETEVCSLHEQSLETGLWFGDLGRE